MKQTLAIIPLALLAGAVSAALTSVFLAPDPVEHQEAIAPDTGLVALETKLDDLLEQNRNLLERVEFLEARPAVVAETPREAVEPETDPETEALEKDIRTLVAAMRNPQAPLPPNLRNGVTEALKEIRAEEDRERDERRTAARVERMEGYLTRMSDELGLAPYQTDELRTLFTDMDTKRNELIQTARDARDFNGVREAMRDMRTESEEGLARILTPAQKQQYEEADLGPSPLRGFGGGGPDRRGAGGNSGGASGAGGRGGGR